MGDHQISFIHAPPKLLLREKRGPLNVLRNIATRPDLHKNLDLTQERISEICFVKRAHKTIEGKAS